MPDEPTSTGTIVVSGTGRVAVQPDVADLRLGVTVAKPTVEAARGEAAATMDAILRAVDGAGVARADVRTAMLSVQPRYDYRDGRAPVLTGYEIANVVEVSVRDLSALGDVIDATLTAGATSMDALSFRLADPRPAEREARRQAMAEAGRGPMSSPRQPVSRSRASAISSKDSRCAHLARSPKRSVWRSRPTRERRSRPARSRWR